MLKPRLITHPHDVPFANGETRVADLVRHAAYQDELLRLMASLTEEDEFGSVHAAKTDAEAFDAIVKFRRRHGLKLLDCEPSYYVIGLHRAIIRHPALVKRAEKIPPDDDAMRARGIINYSEHWLIRQGLGTDLDKEFNPKPQAARANGLAGGTSAGRKK